MGMMYEKQCWSVFVSEKFKYIRVLYGTSLC